MTTSPDSAIHAASSRPGVGKWRRITVVLSHLVAAAFLATNVCATEKRSAKGEQKLYEGYCANIAVGAEMARVERQKKLIAEMEGRLKNQIEALEAREKSLQAIVERIEGFERKTGDALVSFYSRMKPDAAAAQISELDADIAASLLAKLNPKISSAILNEVEPARGAALVRRLASLNAPVGKAK